MFHRMKQQFPKCLHRPQSWSCRFLCCILDPLLFVQQHPLLSLQHAVSLSCTTVLPTVNGCEPTGGGMFVVEQNRAIEDCPRSIDLIAYTILRFMYKIAIPLWSIYLYKMFQSIHTTYMWERDIKHNPFVLNCHPSMSVLSWMATFGIWSTGSKYQ